MTTPTQPDSSGSVEEWVLKAEEDLEAAAHLGGDSDRFRNSASFHYQQAIEKLMKAVLVKGGHVPPRTHDLVELFDLLEGHGVRVAATRSDLRLLSTGAVYARYPGYRVSPDEFADLARISGAIWSVLRPLV